ncbi:unnamed protein product (macronuclear) [Paramecium tetraurelia]|uniref:Uncharacterized protein n=1 Tax=Paramecium tetraurelia TaxID=5888 RepID=A0E955_PARTE|nr:uncharacterized protein GSPATT00024553001 [Paramecium tetraurelia]CAK91822.1 unnamed protein product [Paramecium tetraurelia]|eukprot:XP_001459219.1 hypothetical protein (macronuclear) [Paramecium tetraurelia strain d4-2]
MQTRNWRKKKQLLEKLARKNEATQAKNDQQLSESNREFFQKFQNFYENVKDILIPSLQQCIFVFRFLQEQFHISELLTDQEVYQLQMDLSQQWTPKLRKNWTDDDKQILIWIVLKICARDGTSIRKIPNKIWEEVVLLLSRRTVEQCKNKWNDLLKLSLQQIPWTEEQDILLLDLIRKSKEEGKQNKWCRLANLLNLHFKESPRTGKQCRERWNNHLNPDINRHPWNLEEDIELLEIVKKHHRKWAFISKNLKTKRSENAVKNRFNCLLKKNHCTSITTLINTLKNRFKTENPTIPLSALKKQKVYHYYQKDQDPQKQQYISQSTNQTSFAIKLFDNLNLSDLKNLQPAFYNSKTQTIIMSSKQQLQTFLNNQVIKVENGLNVNFFSEMNIQQPELSNHGSSILNINDSSNFVRYVPCMIPNLVSQQTGNEDKKSQFNIPGLKTQNSQQQALLRNKNCSSFTFFSNQQQLDSTEKSIQNTSPLLQRDLIGMNKLQVEFTANE